HQPARRPADDQSGTTGGRGDRRRTSVATLLARDLAAAPAGHHGGDAVFDHSDIRRFSACLCANRRWSRERHAAVRHLRLSDWRWHRTVEPGRGDFARHVPVPAHRGGGAAPLYPPGRGALSNDRRRKMAALGLLLHSARCIYFLAAVSVLLDAGHFGAAGSGTISAVDGAELHAVLDRAPDAPAHYRLADRYAVRQMDGQYALHCLRLDPDFAVLRHPRRLCPVPPEIPFCRDAGDRHFHHLSGAANAAVYSARQHHPQFPARRYALGADPDVSDVPHSVLHLAADGIFQGDPARA